MVCIRLPPPIVIGKYHLIFITFCSTHPMPSDAVAASKCDLNSPAPSWFVRSCFTGGAGYLTCRRYCQRAEQCGCLSSQRACFLETFPRDLWFFEGKQRQLHELEPCNTEMCCKLDSIKILTPVIFPQSPPELTMGRQGIPGLASNEKTALAGYRAGPRGQ